MEYSRYVGFYTSNWDIWICRVLSYAPWYIEKRGLAVAISAFQSRCPLWKNVAIAHCSYSPGPSFFGAAVNLTVSHAEEKGG